MVETVCDEATVAARLAIRAKEGRSPSDATLATYQRQRAALVAAPPLVPDNALAIQVDTAGDLPNSLDAVFAALQAAEIVHPVISNASVCPAWTRLSLER